MTINIPHTLEKLGIHALNPLQEQTLTAARAHAHLQILAPTGSGKTLAFLLPVWERMQADREGVQALVLSPTRELALQIESVWQQLGAGFKVNTCYGGHDIKTEMNNFRQTPSLLIGTPGRVLDHLNRGSIDLGGVHTLVLDEFDKSLSMGFETQMRDILAAMPAPKQSFLASATARLVLPDFLPFKNSHALDFTGDSEKSTDGLQIKAVLSPEKDKIKTLFRLLCAIGPEQCIVFCNHRESAERVRQILGEWQIPCGLFHGGMDQIDREKALIQFRNGSHTYLVASDLAARGLDIPTVRHIIHYHLPLKKDDFIHRNGRTARMFAEGTAYVLLHGEESIPDFLDKPLDWLTLPDAATPPMPSPWTTLYISGGKKDKLSKTDIVGFLCQKGGLDKKEVGRIDLLDYMAFVAVHAEQADAVVAAVRDEKMKGKKYKLGIAR